MPAKIGILQQLEDGIAFRRARANEACPACTSSRKCAEHASGQRLLEAYEARYTAAWAEALPGMDPGDIGKLLQRPGLPPTAVMLGAAIMASLRQAAAADGPVVTELDGQLVVIEFDGQDLVEHPLLPANGDARPEPPLGCM